MNYDGTVATGVMDLKKVNNGEQVSGLVYVKSYVPKTDFTSKAPLNGEFYHKGKTMKFKIWDRQLQNFFNDNDMNAKIISISGAVGSYKEELDITITSMSLDHGVGDLGLFYKSVDVEGVFAEFTQFVNTKLSPHVTNAVGALFTAEGLFEPFKLTWAGSKMHDAQIGGLMNHTMKMLRIAEVLIMNDKRLTPFADYLYLGIILHDIGKVREIGIDGRYLRNSYITHRSLGVEICAQHRELLIGYLGEDFYYHILAIQQGHHGEHGDKPTTVWAYLIHLIDMLECNVTGFLDRVDNGEIKSKNGNTTIWMGNDGNLVFE